VLSTAFYNTGTGPIRSLLLDPSACHSIWTWCELFAILLQTWRRRKNKKKQNL